MALTARQAPFLWLSRDRPTNHSLVTLLGPQAVKMISLAVADTPSVQAATIRRAPSDTAPDTPMKQPPNSPNIPTTPSCSLGDK